MGDTKPHIGKNPTYLSIYLSNEVIATMTIQQTTKTAMLKSEDESSFP